MIFITQYFVNLNITNIESSKEFCTLNLISHKSVKKIEFKDPIRIEHLDISFTTYDNNPISFNDRLEKNFVKDLSLKLFEWTNQRWIITLSKEKGDISIKEKQKNKKVCHILTVFVFS